MKAKPLFHNQTVTKTALVPSQELVEIIQRIVADILAGETALTTAVAEIRADLGYMEKISADVTNSTTTLAGSGLKFPVEASTAYRFRFLVDYFTGAAATGVRLCIDGPTAGLVNYQVEIASAAGAQTGFYGLNAYLLPATPAPTSATGFFNLAIVEGIVLVADAGDVELVFASETGGVTATIRARSHVLWSKL